MAASEDEMAQWLGSARAGSSEALGKILDTCRNYLLLVANKQLNAELQAKGGASDLVQETFLEAQRDFARFQGMSEGELLAWLRQILLNNAANFTRRFRADMRDLAREVPLGGPDSANGASGLQDSTPTPSSQAIEREQAMALRRALLRLSEEHRQAITLRYLEGRSFEEIGRLLERSPDAARKLWSRAMERLRQEWDGLP